MTATELARKQELCANLNMKFDEANELFGSETLKTMTMAQVNGGVSWIEVLKVVIRVAGGVAGSFLLDKVFRVDSNPATTVDPGLLPLQGLKQENGVWKINGQLVDSIGNTNNGEVQQFYIRTASLTTPDPNID